jgi:YtoQ family protein|tara:strand:+ start:352 stop:801 length:450 start_codon:yes stop_codon:yes gene_type:complete
MLNIYLAGEIHSDWRDDIIQLTKKNDLNVNFSSPVTDHDASDNCGVEILGNEETQFWKDNKGAKLNAIRTRKEIENSDIVIVKFGEKYKQWNAAFDAGYAAALNKSLIIIHSDEHQHALKEVDAAALAVVKNNDQVVKILNYVINGKLN